MDLFYESGMMVVYSILAIIIILIGVASLPEKEK